jgi:predicted DNA-binding transcriptional regulator AlpA
MHQKLMAGVAMPPEKPANTPPQRGLHRVVRTPAASDYLGLSASTLEKLRLTGGGPRFVRIGTRAIGYCIDDLDAFIEGGRRTSTSDPGEPVRPSRDRDPPATTDSPALPGWSP